MINDIPRLTPELVAEMNFLARYDLNSLQEGQKVHKSAAPEVLSAAQRLHDKKLVTQADGGYLTDLGRRAAEHLQDMLIILAAD
jgi:uncharacterized protein (TIGR02647 family)